MATKKQNRLNKQTDAAWKKYKQWSTFAKYEAAVKMIELQSAVRDTLITNVFKPIDDENGFAGIIIILILLVLVVVFGPALLASGQCANPNQCWHG